MTGRACYLSRTDRGGRVVEARLVGYRTDESWSDGEHTAPEAATLAAAWVAQRLSQSDAADTLRLLCVDVDGAACSWITAPSAEPSVVAAAVQGAEGPLSFASRSEASIQALALPAPRTRRRLTLGRKPAPVPLPVGERLAVLNLPDAAARLFIDELDERGVGVDSVLSLWHAIALAWDPGGPAADGSQGPRTDRVVATAPTAAALVLIDRHGRLCWVWSRGGELLTAGSMRMVVEGADSEHSVRIDAQAIARLTTDWLSWSAQLGVAPTRILMIAPPPADEAGASLGPAAIGEALARAWPGAAADLVLHDDPIGATLSRLTDLRAPARTDPRGALVALTHRPSRAHRALLHAAALGLAAAAIALAALSWQTFRSAATTRANTDALDVAMRKDIDAVIPGAQVSPHPEQELEAELDKLRTAHSAPSNLKPAEPILEELDNVSLVLSGIPGVEAEEYNILDSAISIRLSVPDTRTAEDVLQGLREINSHCQWKGQFPAGTGAGGARLVYLLTGAWTHGGQP
ncbi:MAG: hypothetical protein IT437_00275 [Phycisphaerales bacterium]|nr:hypothetical protein [Phycisphaerales bacterium]